MLSFRGIERCLLDLLKLLILAFENDPSQTVGGETNEPLPRLAFPVGKIVGHTTLDISPFRGEITFCFQNRAPNQGVEPALNLRHALLEIQGVKLCSELFDQELAEVGLHLIMAGPRCKMREDITRALLGHRSARRMVESA